MVVFILAAAAAFLLCAPFAPEQLSKWLKRKARTLLLTLFLFLLAAALFILVAAAARPREVGLVLLALPILSLIFALCSLVYRLPTSVPPAAGWPRKYGLFVLLGLVAIAFLVLVALLAIPVSSFWFRPVAIVLAIYTWLIVAGFRAFLARSTHPAFKWLRRHKWQTKLILRSLLFTAVLSTLIAWNGDAWAYAILLTIQRVTSIPETIHALLGVVAGLMCGNFSRWMDYARSRGVGKAETSSQSQPDDGARPAAGQAKENESASVNSANVSTGGGAVHHQLHDQSRMTRMNKHQDRLTRAPIRQRQKSGR